MMIEATPDMTPKIQTNTMRSKIKAHKLRISNLLPQDTFPLAVYASQLFGVWGGSDGTITTGPLSPPPRQGRVEATHRQVYLHH